MSVSKPRSGNRGPSSIKRKAKIVISKSLGKRRQSTRNMAKRLTAQGHPTSKTAIHRYLKNTLKVRSYKRPQCPRLSQKEKNHLLKFCKDRISWSSEQCASVIFSDEAPSYLCELNRQIDRFWSSMAKISRLSHYQVSPHLMVWSAMSARGVSELHFIPQKCSVNAKYYVENILAGTSRDAFAQKRSTGIILQRKLCENMSDSIFQQDGAPAHISKLSQQWCQKIFPTTGPKMYGQATHLTFLPLRTYGHW